MRDTIYYCNKLNTISIAAKECTILDIDADTDGLYSVRFMENGIVGVIWIGTENTGIVFEDGTEYLVNKNGKINIKGIKEYLYNRKINQIIEKL